jgi:hypothetical protein
VPHDGRPAAVLLTDVADAGRRMQELMVNVGEREVLPWPRFTHAWLRAQLQREADEVFRTVARRVGAAELNLGSVFDLIAAGRLAEIAEPFFPNATRREAGPLFAEVLELLMRLAAVESGAAGWQHSWAEPAHFVNVHGYPLSLSEEAKLAVAPGGLDEAYRRLRDMGIDITKAGMVEQQASAVGAGVIAALANVKVNEVEFDLLVLDRGLVFVPNPGKSDKGKQRLQELVGSAPAQELAERYHFVPFEEVKSATVTKRVPARADLALHDGRTLAVHETWGSELITKNSRDVLLDVFGRLNDE